MKVGFAQADITPSRPMPLCGFAARCDAQFEGVDDRIAVRALALSNEKQTIVILSYDLLALGVETTARIMASLRGCGETVQFILCATHTHSAPAAILLRGCGTMQGEYQDLLVSASVDTAEKALDNMKSAAVSYAAKDIVGQTYNRRRILQDGRVTMAKDPDGTVIKEGPVLPRMVLVRFNDDAGRGIGGIVSWPCHPDTVCGVNITADFPGELCRRLTAKYDLPFLFLQGAGANINPFFEKMTRQEMLRNTDAVVHSLGEPAWSQAPDGGLELTRQDVELSYDRPFTSTQLREMRGGMAQIAASGTGSEDTMTLLGDILNVRPGTRPEMKTAKYFAAVIRDWCEDMLLRPDEEHCVVSLSVLRMNSLLFCFVAAEPFAETAIELQNSFPEEYVTLVGYAAPLVGYLPTDQALDEGGYEVDDAYRFYNHPGPFRKGSEPKVLAALRRMIS